jgi:hypothetical protein
VSPLSLLGLTESIGDLYSVILGVAAFAVLLAFLHALERV